MNILCAADEAFLPHCGIMLRSLFDSNQGVDVCVWLIVPQDIDDDSIRNISALAQKYQQEVRFIRINPNDFMYCPIREGDNVTLAAYYRILAPAILPEGVDRILYLDCDIIVNGNLCDFYNQNLDGVSCAVVTDPIAFGSAEYERLGYDRKLSYFNSGVMLMNLNYWRQHKVMEQCFDFIKKSPEKVLWHDQDALNFVLRESKIEVGITYNFQSQFLYKQAIWGELTPALKGEINKVLSTEPIIIHYSNSDKPWRKGSMHPYKEYYNYHKRLSAWRSVQMLPPVNKASKSIKSIIFNLMVILRLCNRPSRYIVYPFKKH